MATDGENDLSKDASFFMNISLDGIDLVSSTPQKPAKKTSRQALFKKPKAPKVISKGPIVATCKICGKQYCTLRYYKQHMQGHVLKDIASRAPDYPAVVTMAPDVAATVMDKMISKPSVGLYAPDFYELMGILTSSKDSEEWKDFIIFICEQFQSVIAREKFLMPSVLSNVFLKVCDNILSSPDMRVIILDKLLKIVPNSNTSVLNSFVCEFVLAFCDQLLVQIFRQLRNASTSESVRTVTFGDKDRQVTFYIGGSIFHGFYQMSYRYPKSKKWQLIKEIINTKIKEDKSTAELSEQQKLDRQWTEKKNRGGLIFVKENVMQFLLSTAAVVAAHEGDDGSISIDKIMCKVVEGRPKYDWDAVIGTSLDQDLSFSLMVGVVKSYMNTYGKGVLKKKMNMINNNKATVSLNLRHKVAPH